ncbi:acyltransferase family protein [Thalassovita mangrovi]|uniref:Acyltransferase family protein n=1 Tax=Thalassovita mangrovi TaxID=2692236 RepID=A0A6L8LI02_9RHOB|nr:acyltransferase family protein [Thalassovita mangrovi]MYM54030.1 acyltransferase family protein [Thalassovita mangrovi]
MLATATTSIPQARPRHGGLDIIRLVLACLVVLAHASFFLTIGPEVNFVFLNGVARIIVPFFFVMSGYFFEAQTRDGIWPWARRVLSFYLIWTLVYLPIILIYEDFSPLRLGFYALFGYAHLWFLPALLGGGLIFHLLRNIGNRRLIVLAVLLVAAAVALQYYEDVTYDMAHLALRRVHEAESRNFLFMGFPFVAIGVVIRRTGFAEGQIGPRDWGLLALALAAMAVEVGFNFRFMPPDGIYEVIFSALLVAPMLFRFAKRLPLQMQGRAVRDLSSAIYFSHLLLLIPLREHFHPPFGALAGLTLALTFALAPLLLMLNRRIPLF